MEAHIYLVRLRYSFSFLQVYNLMKEGIVKFFNESKGYGFIKDTASDNEYFVHISGLVDEIRQDDEVTFELKEGKKGLNAVNVRVTNN